MTQFDIAHAVIAGILIYATIYGMHRAGLYKPHKDGGPRWSWPLFFGIIIVLTVFNVIWP